MTTASGIARGGRLAFGEDPGGVLREVYGAKAWLWGHRWRLFFLSVAGLFGDSGGTEWGVSHYRLKPVAETA